MLLQLALAVLVGLVAGLAVTLGLVRARSRAMSQLADDVTRDVEPYLRRRAAEIGFDPARPAWNSRHTASERVNFSIELARRLTAHARGEDPSHSNTALAQTVPVVDSSEVTAPRVTKGDKSQDG